MNSPSTAVDLARNAPLTGSAVYLSFMSQYGSTVVTTLAIIYGLLQMWLRYKEHKAIMTKNKED